MPPFRFRSRAGYWPPELGLTSHRTAPEVNRSRASEYSLLERFHALRAYHVRNGNDPFVWEVLQLSYRANGVAPPSTVDWNEPAGKASTPFAGQKVVQPYRA